ncbi:hypothetical protein LNKW23_26180 [Paralimibaculum aggregatum]|uniref:Tyrosinase copper-binding domain-containing protein n=1 Tax=Paralimibaculum aggregatum TaxID=3036245 RepID=A0ABQ6LM92_9RHOB|nr:tyrosinase family protein [Limibaculum sp. NKW23]GMG83405.1 hypothetical protein LNKW23_26180 [Limibaculum sp. NKW23]
MFTRRRFLSSAAGIAAFGATLAGRTRILAQDVPRRRPLHEMDLDDPDLITFRNFVGQMRNNDQIQGSIGWEDFAQVHARFCPHGNWYFLPWHRAYLRMYEHAARELTGQAGFALPYWDWTASPAFPRAFADESFDGRPNPLHVRGRAVSAQNRMPDDMTGAAVLESCLREQTYERFASFRPRGQNSTDPFWIQQPSIQATLESNPHNRVHMIIGAHMPTMTSPRDPIFLMHHGNVDRIWALWNAQGGSNTRNRFWTDMVFNNNFMILDGRVYSERVAELQVPESLGFSFGLPQPVPAADGGIAAAREELLAALVAPDGGAGSPGIFRRSAVPPAPASPERPLSLSFAVDTGALGSLLGGRPVTAEALEPGVGAGTGSGGLESVSGLLGEGGGGTGGNFGAGEGGGSLGNLFGEEESGAPAPSPTGRQEVFALISDMGTTAPFTTELRVFVNKPDASAATPPTDPHFAGAVAFFGLTEKGDCVGGPGKPSVALNITPVLERLAAAGSLSGGAVSVQLVPAGHATADPAAAGTVCPAEVAIVIA